MIISSVSVNPSLSVSEDNGSVTKPNVPNFSLMVDIPSRSLSITVNEDVAFTSIGSGPSVDVLLVISSQGEVCVGP